VARQLSRQGVEALPIHGGRSQNQRTAALRALHEGRIEALVATDVAARGIHVDDLACVVHFDAPEDQETYVHRSGRTGRAGSSGVVLNFVDAGDVRSGSLRRSPAPKGVAITVTSVDRLADDLGGDPSAAPVRRKVETVATVATAATSGGPRRTGARRSSARGAGSRGRRSAAGSNGGGSNGSGSTGGGSNRGGSSNRRSNGSGTSSRKAAGTGSNGRGQSSRGSKGRASQGGSSGGGSQRGRQPSGGGSASGRRG
jgi:superfamily II DNA/RNA helicase